MKHFAAQWINVGGKILLEFVQYIIESVTIG